MYGVYNLPLISFTSYIQVPMSMKKEVLAQVNTLIETGQQLIEAFLNHQHGTIFRVPETERRAYVTSALAAIERIAGKNSQFFENIPQEIITSKDATRYRFISTVTGVLLALRNEIDQGLLESLESRLRANIHDDFLIQASVLFDAGYHVAAMVLIGGVLENHLQKMILAHGLKLPKNGNISKYNDSLRDKAYVQTVWRRIQSIGDLRNDVAHGKGSTLDSNEVKDALAFVQRFIADHST